MRCAVIFILLLFNWRGLPRGGGKVFYVDFARFNERGKKSKRCNEVKTKRIPWKLRKKKNDGF